MTQIRLKKGERVEKKGKREKGKKIRTDKVSCIENSSKIIFHITAIKL
jgi:hypothetical protein